MTTPNLEAQLRTLLAIADDADVIAAVSALKTRAETPIPADYQNPADVASIRQLRRELARVEPLLDALEVPDDATDPVATAVARANELKESAGYDSSLWAVPRYCLAAGFVILMVFALLAKLWLGVLVAGAVVAAIILNIRSNKQKTEALAEMLGYGVLLAYLLYSLASPATPAWVWTSTDGTRPPAAEQPAQKTEAQKLRELFSGTSEGQPMQLPDELYSKVERKGNTIRMPKLDGIVEANWSLLVSPTKGLAVKEGAPNVTVDGEYLVYTSPADPTSYRIYLDPHDLKKLPSKARDLPSSK